MKLFQIEEPDGTPLEADGPGAAVGIDVAAGGIGRVAVAVGGNAEILPDGDGARSLAAPGAVAAELFLALRSRAEKQLARPVTHAVIAADGSDRAAVESAAKEAGIAILRLMTRGEAAALATGAAPDEAAALGAAMAAEDLAPPAEDLT
jgi:molecular chaperone DnaK (HSP70)